MIGRANFSVSRISAGETEVEKVAERKEEEEEERERERQIRLG